MLKNAALFKGLFSVVGLNFASLSPKQQLEMMKPMESRRYQKAKLV